MSSDQLVTSQDDVVGVTFAEPQDDDDSGSEQSFAMQVTLDKIESFDLRKSSSHNLLGMVSPGNGPDGEPLEQEDRVEQLVRTTSNMHLSSSFIENRDSASGCMGCEEAQAVVYCRHCSALYCAACDKQAHALKNKASHTRVPQRQAHTQPALCAFHQNRECELFCNTCNQAVCELCRDYGTHQRPAHDVVSVRVVADAARETICNELEAVQDSIAESQAVLDQVEAALLATKSSDAVDRAKASILAQFKGLEEIAQARRRELLAEVEEDIEWKKGGLSHQQNLLQEVVSNGTDLLAACEKALQSGGHPELSTALDRVDLFFSESNPVMKYTDPVERSRLDVSLREEEILEAIRTTGAIGGPLNVRFSVPPDGRCLLSWSAPLFPSPSPPTSDDGTLVSFHARLLLLGEDGNEEPVIKVELGQRPVGLGEDMLGEFSMSVDLRQYVGARVAFAVCAVLGSGRQSAWSHSQSAQQLPEVFVRRDCAYPEGASPFNRSGLMYVLGTDFLVSAYMNPHTSGAVNVTWSTQGSGDVHHFVAHSDPVEYSYTANVPYSWMAVDIGEGREFRPTGYSLRHDQQGARGALRNWELQARPEGGNWCTISSHQNDASLNEAGSEAYFPLPDAVRALGEEGYRHFRVLQIGKNSSGKDRLSCAGFELYGMLC